jgi:hypothetical protein
MASLTAFASPALLCGCLAATHGLPPSFEPAFDLDGNGILDTALRIEPCRTSAQSACLISTSLLSDPREIPLDGSPASCPPPLTPATIEDIGDHVNGPFHEVAVIHCPVESSRPRPTLSIVDVERGSIVARTAAPEGQTSAYANWPRDPIGRRYPFLAPTYGDSSLPENRPSWGYLCLFQPLLPSDSGCGDRFVRIEARPASEYFREYGGYVQDLDGDGWEDIHLLFHRLVYTVSTKTGLPLATTEFDVAAGAEPSAPKWFHSGRNYGAHVSSVAPDGSSHTALIGGVPVGSFNDMNCNVSRFLGLLESRPGRPETRRLQWSRYYGFASTIFETYGPERADHPESIVARQADYLNGCLHYPSDARSQSAGEPILVVNRFLQEAPVARCIREQYQLYLPPAWSEEKTRTWNRCFNQNLHGPGTWTIEVLRENDGTLLIETPSRYVWGLSEQLHPGREPLYFFEVIEPEARSFDLRLLPMPRLTVQALDKGQWIDRGTFPIAGRPRLRRLTDTGPRGHGSASYFYELMLDDVDGDGLQELQLEDGTWIGWSKTLAAWAVKEPRASSR